jgi:hypothetical protein
MTGRHTILFLLGAVLCLCKTNAQAGSGYRESKAEHRGILRLQMENDRLGGSDDGHTYSFRSFLELPDPRPSLSFSINYESLTQRYKDSRVDLLGVDAAFGYPVWASGQIAFTVGVAANGDLGGEVLQNALHEWLNESSLHLSYPDSYNVGVTAGTRLSRKLTDINGFRLTGRSDFKVASGAAPSRVGGGIYLGRHFIIFPQTNLDLQFGLSLYDHFLLDEILKPYYGRGYSLDSSLGFEWKRLAINLFYNSNPYGIDQGILGAGIGCFF